MNRDLPTTTEMYNALIERDSSYDGIFLAGIKTTGIFCRPTCTAKKPKPDNVEYFRTPHEALAGGFRPCKICKPLQPRGAVPEWLAALFDEITAHPMDRIQNHHLRERGLDPARVRYWFKKQYGLTFSAYQRALRVGQAYSKIREGGDVTSAAFDSGYQSLSGFGESFKSATGFAPQNSPQERVIVTERILTPLGPMLAGAIDDRICLLEFLDRPMLETQLKRLNRFFKAAVLPGDSPIFAALKRQLEEYFAGKLRDFDLPLRLSGSPFQEAVWVGLRTIPYGCTRSYAEQAAAIGKPTAVRAVAHANGDNRIAILIPCHRVIGADGRLTGYGGGLWRKQYLLDLESSHN